ncbi:MAG: ADP-ribosylation factor [Linnemannia gamsii]|nr:MAG: ADP-ribosylation factor [Linnemannia gamsii]
MGMTISNMRMQPHNCQRDRKILMLGLDSSGKTAILYGLSTKSHVRLIPTIGFNIMLVPEIPQLSPRLPVAFLLCCVDPSTIVSSTGFNVEQVTILGVQFTVWDVAGSWGTRSLWHQFAKGAKAIICVVDSADETHIEETKEWLWRMYMDYDPDRESVLLVFANKQDRLGALSVSEVKDRLGMETRTQGRRWHIQGSIATTGDGLMDGMVWIASQLKDVSRT